jgi:Ca2+-binding EF-hand superfamily protein
LAESNRRTVWGADGKVDDFFIGPAVPQTAEQRNASFTAADLNADGKVDKPEYGTMLTAAGYPERLDSFFAQLGADKNGQITAKEFEKDPR